MFGAISIPILIFVKFFKTIHRFELTSTYAFNREQIKRTLGSICVHIYLPLIFGALMELGGYLSRIISIHNTFASVPFVVGTVLLLIAPIMMNASIYFLFEKMLKCLNVLDTSCVALFMRNSVMVKFFIVADVIFFFLQAAGSEILAKDTVVDSGRLVVLIGLVIQMVTLLMFLFVQLNFTFRYKKYSKDDFYLKIDYKWKYLNHFLLSATVLLLLRTAQKFAEFLQSRYFFFYKYEWFLYVFDALPMFLILVLLSFSFIFIDIGELYYNYYTINYEEKREIENDELQKTESRESLLRAMEIPDWKGFNN